MYLELTRKRSQSSYFLFILRLCACPILLQSAPAYQRLLLFIPQAEEQRFEAFRKRQRFDLEHGILVVAFLQFVIGDPWAQVMDVMKTNIACKPLQQFGEPIE